MKPPSQTRFSPGGLARTALVLLLAGFALPTRADDSLAREVPADTGLFVEMSGAEDLLTELSEPQVWLALAELAGQPASEAETEEWRRRIQQTVGMAPEVAIRTLFSRSVAFVGEGFGRAQDAVVLCRPATPIPDLLAQWNAERVGSAGETRLYKLPGEVSLGVRDNFVFFGDATPADGMFRRVAHFERGPQSASLAEDETYRRLLKRAPANPDGVFFARVGTPPGASTASQPAKTAFELPGPLRGSSNILLALHRDKEKLHFSAVGDAPGTDARHAELEKLVATLPDNTLAAWAGPVDYGQLFEAANELPEQNALRIGVRLLEKPGTLERLTDSLEPATCLALGYATPEERRVSAPPIPAAALLIRTSDPHSVETEMTAALEAMVSTYNLLAIARGLPAISPIQKAAHNGTQIREVDLSSLLGQQPQQTPLTEVHLAWAMDDDVLILASNTRWLRRVLDARHDRAERLQDVLRLSRERPGKTLQTLTVLQTGPIADFAGRWLQCFEQVYPQILSEAWWRKYQPGGRAPSLGLNVTPLGDQKRLRIDSVAAEGPAAGLLRPGDEIIGLNGKRFATDEPVHEAQAALVNRPEARWIDVHVQRGETQLTKRIALPFVDPIQLLRRTVAIGRIAQRVVYHDESTPEGPRGFLTIELRKNAEPLYSFDFYPLVQTVSPEGEPKK